MFAHSLRLVLPRMTAPASRSFFATKAVLGRRRSDQRQRAGRRLHAVARRDVVFDEHWDAVERPARPLGLALLVQFVGDRKRVGIHFEHRIDAGPALVNLVDAREVFLGEGARREFAGLHSVLQRGEGDFIELEGGDG